MFFNKICLKTTLSNEGKVFTWGNNQNGQCGIGNTISTVCTPQLLASLTGVPIKQVSAGTTHSIIWCCSPPDGIGVAQQKPFTLDIHQDTFIHLRELLEKYSTVIFHIYLLSLFSYIIFLVHSNRTFQLML